MVATDRPLSEITGREARIAADAAAELEKTVEEIKRGKFETVAEVANVYDTLLNRAEFAANDTFPLIGWDAYETPPGKDFWPKK